MESQNINLIDRTFSIIEYLASSRQEVGVSEISRALKIPKSGIFRILNSLKDHGYIYQNPVNRGYGLGLNFYFIGAAVGQKLPICRKASEVLEPLADKTGLLLSLSLPYYSVGTGPRTILSYVSSNLSEPQKIKSHTHEILTGTIKPSNTTAAGICILSYESDSQIQTYKTYPLEGGIKSWDELVKIFSKIRKQGWYLCKDSPSDGIYEIAVPVFDGMHAIIGAVSFYTSSDTEKKTIEQLVRSIRSECRAIGV